LSKDNEKRKKMWGAGMLQEAESFIRTCYGELGYAAEVVEARLAAIKQEIDTTGAYVHTTEELEHGFKMAWRNSNKCIGRLFWASLQVIDGRACKTEAEIADVLVEHIRVATNDGKIKPTISVFAPHTQTQPEIRIWNYQLIRYAGYETEHGIVGDPYSVTFTKLCQDMGWQGKGGAFDLLPLVIQIGDKPPQWFDLPDGIVLEVPLEHPEYPAFQALGLKWYAVPMVSDMLVDMGGLRYTAAPFNGWYMGTEIGARNLADESRYNLLPVMADIMGVERNEGTFNLWKDKALVELNVAVLYSFKRDGISIVDHHTAAQQFKKFEEREASEQRNLTGDWSWLIPPVSPATTHVFHNQYNNELVKPTFEAQPRRY
jgi:nitric-oxide synthase